MNDTHTPGSGTDARTGLFGDPGRLAPHLDKAWRDDFIIELRFLGVPGERIGDALVTADSHVRESGESAEQAFGDAVDYARETAAAIGTADDGWRITPGLVVGNVAGLVGMLGVVAAFTAWLENETVTLTLGSVLGLGAVCLLLVTVLTWPVAILRFAVGHRILVPVLAPLVLTGGFVGILLLFRQPLVQVGAPAVAVVSVALMALSGILSWTGSAGDEDEITAPGQAAGPGKASRLAAALVLPVLTGALLLLTWALSGLG